MHFPLFRLMDVLDHGGFSSVYLAEDLRTAHRQLIVLIDWGKGTRQAAPFDFHADCWHVLWLLDAIRDRLIMLCPASAERLTDWGGTIRTWLASDPPITAHHLLSAWWLCFPSEEKPSEPRSPLRRLPCESRQEEGSAWSHCRFGTSCPCVFLPTCKERDQ